MLGLLEILFGKKSNFRLSFNVFRIRMAYIESPNRSKAKNKSKNNKN